MSGANTKPLPAWVRYLLLLAVVIAVAVAFAINNRRIIERLESRPVSEEPAALEPATTP
jgi:hypothetical protein